MEETGGRVFARANELLGSHPRVTKCVATVVGLLAIGVLAKTGGDDPAAAETHVHAVVEHRMAAQKVIHRKSRTKTQTILNKIHSVLPDVDGSVDPNARKILPTSAYLKPSEGGFKTKCGRRLDDKRGLVLRSYKITPSGQWYSRCNRFSTVWPNSIQINEYKRPLNVLGRSILKSLSLSFSRRQVKRVGGSRRKVTAKFVCPSSEGAAAPGALSNAKRVVLRRARNGSRATIWGC